MEGAALVVSGQVTGVSVHTDGAEATFRFVRLQRAGDEVRILGQGEATNARDLLIQVGSRVPIALSVLTPRCLHRVLRRVGPLEELVPLAFPGAAMEQILAAGWREGEATGVSMMRKEHAEPVLHALRETGFRVVDVSPGPWSLLQLRPVLGQNGLDDTIGGHHFPNSDGLLSGYVPATKEDGMTRFGTDEVSDKHVLALSIAWTYLLPADQRLVLHTAEVLHDQREERARTWYERGLLALAGILMLLLCADALLKAQVVSAQLDPTASVDGRAALLADLEELRGKVQVREALAVQLGLTRTEPFAVRAARVLDQVPPGIQLDRMMIDPLVAGLRQRERPAVTDRRIRIQGSCPNGHVFNAWMNTLRATEGIRSVRLISFTAETPNKQPTFHIELET
jgi:hypothetical protein